MRTTLDIPDTLFRQAKARAALEGIPLKEVVAESLRRLLGESGLPVTQPRRTSFPLIPAGRARPAMTRVSVKEEIERLENERDLHHAGSPRH